ncbi:MAG: REP-associated tyrosine transposase [Candidatus Acidiferrales bacterium]
MKFERQIIIATARSVGRSISPTEQQRLKAIDRKKLNAILDQGSGSCSLAIPAVAELVAQTLLHFESTRYRLFAWCVMPNHVHTLFRLLGNHDLATVLHAWKSYSAKRANALLKRSGEFWQREYFDHLVRSEDEFHRIVAYILQNPRKAGLQHWPWSKSHLTP